MSKSININIKNANKLFKHKTFKLMGHDFPVFLRQIVHEISEKEYNKILELNDKLEKEAGDYEVFITVLKDKIKVTKFY